MGKNNIHTALKERVTGQHVLRAVLLAALTLTVFVGSALAAGNLVKNGSFEKDTDGDGTPNQWTEYNQDPDAKRVCNTSAKGNCSFKFKGTGSGPFIDQVISQSGIAGDEYRLTAWYRTKSLVLEGSGATISMGLRYVDNTSDFIYIVVPAGTHAWQKPPAQNLIAAKNYSEIVITVNSNSATSGAWWVDAVNVAPVP